MFSTLIYYMLQIKSHNYLSYGVSTIRSSSVSFTLFMQFNNIMIYTLKYVYRRKDIIALKGLTINLVQLKCHSLSSSLTTAQGHLHQVRSNDYGTYHLKMKSLGILDISIVDSKSFLLHPSITELESFFRAQSGGKYGLFYR
jgi:hypothetical protein